MKKIIALLLCASFLCILLASCGSPKEDDSKYPRIVTTSHVVADWTWNILDGAYEIFQIGLLADQGKDMHNFQPSAADMRDIAAADILIYIGGESDKWVEDAVNEGLTLEDIGSSYYHSYMKNQYEAHLTTITAYITPVDGIFGDDNVALEGKTWGEAFEHGLIEGLFVWPISALLYYLSIAFSGLGAFGTVLAILIVTIIVRGIILLCTWKQTASQQKMQEIQPEIEKLQQKYPNSNTNETERNLLAQEQMKLYQKHDINPLGSLITLIIQFPVFIAVWGAMSGSAILREGDIFGLQLSAATGQSILEWNMPSSIVAIVIFVLMAAAQATSMLLPQHLAKQKAKKVEKTKKSPAAEESQSQTQMMSWVMLVMIIVMGFSLPVAMAIYWIISALISLTQSLIMSSINNKDKKNGKDGFANYKTVKK